MFSSFRLVGIVEMETTEKGGSVWVTDPNDESISNQSCGAALEICFIRRGRKEL